MKIKTFISGILSVCLLMIAKTITLLHLPNYAPLIVLGILIFVFIQIPILLLFLNRKKANNKLLNVLVSFSLFIFCVCLFLVFQDIAMPLYSHYILLGISAVFLAYTFINKIINSSFRFNPFTFSYLFVAFIILVILNLPVKLQAPDYSFSLKLVNPSYAKGMGPVVFVDESHNNFHTLSNRLIATGHLLEADGYTVIPLTEKISNDKLKECNILIIINAINEKNIKWENPIFSAFTEQEILNIKNWVSNGGSLLLVADHMPFPEAINNLAKEFGFVFENGHAINTSGNMDYFYRKSKTLHDNIITNGKSNLEKVDSILTFSGCSFHIPDDAINILEFDSTWVSYNPDRAWEFNNVQPFSIKGLSQGAYKQFNNGRVVVFGEAMMFTAQLGGGLSWIKIGMNSKKCPNNYKLFLNIIHWLDYKRK